MSGAFFFNGKSRSSHLSLSRDHQPSREAILLEARKKRERREKDRQMQQAVLCIQRNVRLWISRMILADLAEALFKRIEERPQEAETRSLEQLCWDYTFLHRGKHGKNKTKNTICQRNQAQIIFQRLLSSIRAGTVRDELLRSRCSLNLLLVLALNEYVKPSLDTEKNDIVEWQNYHLTLLSALFEVAALVNDRGNILVQILSFFVEHGTTGTERILPLVQNLFGILSADEVRSAMTSVKGREMLLNAIRSSIHDKPYTLPTAYALDVLLGSSSELPNSNSSNNSNNSNSNSVLYGEANQALVESIVNVASEKLSTVLYIQPIAPLAKLVRLIPFFLNAQSSSLSTTTNSLGMEVRKKWTRCLSQLTLMSSREGELLRTALQDLRHLQNVESTQQRRYEHMTTYLFSTEYGLRLLEESVALIASSSSSTTVGGTGTVEVSTTNVTLLNSSKKEEKEENSVEEKNISDSQNEMFTNLDVICSIFAWPLYAFTYSSAEQRIEATTIISKLVHSPGLLQSLWRTYQYCHKSTFGGLTEMKKEALIHEAMTGVPVHLPPPEEPPAELVKMASYTNSVRSLFWDPYPAISTLLFGMLSYFVDATDFLEGLDRRTVMDHNDAIILVLALKGIVHRSHFHGVLSLGNSEAVAESALSLLSKLHVINEAQSFVSYPSVWITITDPLFLKVFDSITREVWMSFVLSERTHGVSSANALDTEEKIIIYSYNDHNYENQDDMDEKNNNNNDNNNNNNNSKMVKQLGEGNCPFIRLPQWSGSSTWSRQERCIRLLQNVPFTVPFDVRASVFTSFLLSHEGRLFTTAFRPFLVRRGQVFVDAFDRFGDNPNSPEMFNVRFRDTNDMVEEGYGEGVYREFLVSLCNEGFAAEYGLFKLTDDGYVYPNPFSYEVTGDPRHLRRIEFLGSMMGRALRDGVLQDVPFALHFRNSILGRSNSINNLKSFDKQMYRNLVSLLSLSDEEIESLSLNFTYNVDILGETREVELLHGGRDIPVTRRNCLNYIHLMADFKLNRESARQTKAFQNGLECIVDQSWLRLFDSKEIMKLFGGDAESAINVADWQRHTQYHEAKDAESTPVQLFWRVVETMTGEQRKKLLKFCTSMNRPPLLGFQFLNPPFKIHVVWDAPEQRLPSASTCFSTVKLPPYRDMETAWKKITEAIEETEDFGLT